MVRLGRSGHGVLILVDLSARRKRRPLLRTSNTRSSSISNIYPGPHIGSLRSRCSFGSHWWVWVNRIEFVIARHFVSPMTSTSKVVSHFCELLSMLEDTTGSGDF